MHYLVNASEADEGIEPSILVDTLKWSVAGPRKYVGWFAFFQESDPTRGLIGQRVS